MVRLLAAALGNPAPKTTRMPRWLMSAIGLLVPIVRELKEMAYQFEEPFVVDDSRFRARFGFGGTPLEEGARETVAWARAR
jgi:nucleoside-diphosphate-sugar epimerase